MTEKTEAQAEQAAVKTSAADKASKAETSKVTEIGGRKGPEPTRYGDWEKNGIISDF